MAADPVWTIVLPGERKLSDLLLKKREYDNDERVAYRAYRTSAEWWGKIEDKMDLIQRALDSPEFGALHLIQLRKWIRWGYDLEWDADTESYIGEAPPRKSGEHPLLICEGWIPTNHGTHAIRREMYRMNLERCERKLEELKQIWLTSKAKRDAVAAQLRRVREIMRTEQPISGMSDVWRWTTRSGMFVGHIVKDA